MDDNKKLTIKEFDEIKQKLNNIVEEALNIIEQNKNNHFFSKEETKTIFQQKYLKLQNELLSYDLSDIPFENWENLTLSTFDKEKIIDFSKTKANIDFAILDILEKGNFKNCNIRNIDKIEKTMDEELFDKVVVDNYPDIFLSEIFSESFKIKYYNSNIKIEDLSVLTEEQLEELKNKKVEIHLYNYSDIQDMVETIEIEKMIQLYKLSPNAYEIVKETMSHNNNIRFENDYISYLEKIKKCNSVEEIKNITYEYRKDKIINSDESIDPNDYSEIIKKEFEEIFLENSNLSFEIKDKFYKRELEIEDLESNFDIFKNTPVEYFMNDKKNRVFGDNIGKGSLIKILKDHKDVFKEITNNASFYEFGQKYKNIENFEVSFYGAVKDFFRSHYGTFSIIKEFDEYGNIKYKLPKWMSSMEFNILERFNDIKEINKYNYKTFLLNRNQDVLLNIFNLDYIIKFEKQTGFFSYKKEDSFNELENLDKLGLFLSVDRNPIPKINSYEQFVDYLARCFNEARIKHSMYINYDCIKGDFREKYSNIFINDDAPQELKKCFYENRITPELIHKNKEYIPYLLEKNLENILLGNYESNFINSKSINQYGITSSIKDNFISYYSDKYGNKELLNLISKYGDLCCNLSKGEFDISSSKEEIEKQFRKAIYKRIIDEPTLNYKEILTQENDESIKFVKEYPDIFIEYNLIPIEDESQKYIIFNKFYNRKLLFEDIYMYPQLVDFFKNKNLKLAFGNYELIDREKSNSEFNLENINSNLKRNRSELNLIDIIGNENFLKLCSKYGRYLENIEKYWEEFQDLKSYEKICLIVEKIIANNCLDGKINYLPEDSPSFLKKQYPELFLNEDAPQELKESFYCINNFLTFNLIKNNKDWLPYLKRKSVKTAFLRANYRNKSISDYFELFGQEKALEYGIEKTETVEMMISSRQVDIMKNWYDKTGQRFIPDFVIMQNFNIEEADKFLISSRNWAKLMKIHTFSKTREGRDALLKLAYSFGIFDQDQIGIKKLKELLTGIPRQLNIQEYNRLIMLENNIKEYLNKIDNYDIKPHGVYEYNALKKELINEGFRLENDSVIKTLYNVSDNSIAILKINPQSDTRYKEYLRKILEIEKIVLNSQEAHQLFGGFILKYDKEFREFLLANIQEIRKNPEYGRFISNIQKQFQEIKSYNSNRVLTLDLAVSFVQTNKYLNVNIGNEKVAEISAIAGYSQNDFDILQQIYNYGKQRTFSSIPRIEKTEGNYTYEILRLDDPMALAIGTLTDCCQELNNCAELCMEHSVVDKNGRIFIIKDNEGNIISQSWVWRNQDVLCFDNIEIPKKALTRRLNNVYTEEKKLPDIIYELYKKASHDLIEEDNRVYKELLENGKITKEQYEGLKLRKVTVGLGFNDIAEVIRKNLPLEEEITKPLPFEEPVMLANGLYTCDSDVQYILEENSKEKDYKGKTLSVHADKFIEYTDKTFDNKDLLTLKKLEYVTKKSPYLKTEISQYEDLTKIVTSISKNYGLNSDTTRIIMNPNFAIIYDINGNNLKIADLLYNTKVDNGKQQIDITEAVLTQIKLALDQISENKIINTNSLTKKQQDTYIKATKINTDIERGVSRAR